MELKKGWINRKLDLVEKEVNKWPEWMREELRAEASRAREGRAPYSLKDSPNKPTRPLALRGAKGG